MEKIEILPQYWLCKPLDGEEPAIHVLFTGYPAFFAQVIPSENPEKDPHTVKRLWTVGEEDELSAGYADEMTLIWHLQEAGLLPPDVNSKHFQPK